MSPQRVPARRSKSPQMWITAGSGMVGGFLAVLADVAQKDDASAVLNLASGIAKLHIRCEPIVVALLLILLAGALCLIFEAANKKAAFYIGASILTVIMTVVPVRRAPSIEALPEKTPDSGPAASGERLIRRAAFEPAEATGRVILTLRAPGQQRITEVTVEIRNPASGATLASSTYSNSTIDLALPPDRVAIRVSVPGYKLAQQTLSVRPGQVREVQVDLEPTAMPLGLQKLFGRYAARSPSRVKK